MRAVCERCAALQPADWQAGDLCGTCGEASRRDVRCPWCTRLTPKAAFCRACGSGLVPAAWYGAARMLKAAGVDQFSVPERLAQLPDAQRDHFSRLYAPHSRALERQVDDLAYVESFLRGGGWSRALEDEWLPHLPLPPETLAQLTGPPSPAPNHAQAADLERLAHIRDSSPLPHTAQLAALARIRLGAPRSAEDSRRAGEAMRSPDEQLREEAALALGHWRFVTAYGYAVQPGTLRDELLAVYRRSGHVEAALGLALLAAQYANVQSLAFSPELFAPLLGAEDPGVAFAAALVLGQTDLLVAALKHPERRHAAARCLIRQGQAAPVAAVFLHLTPDEQEDVLSALRFGVGQIGEWCEVLATVLDTSPSAQLRRSAAHVLVREGRPEDALRLVAADPSSFADPVLRSPALSAHDLEAVCLLLLRLGEFDLSRVPALSELARSGRAAQGVVPGAFAGADEAGQQELCAFAGQQLRAGGGPGLPGFLWQVIEQAPSLSVRARAWHALSGWYQYPGEGQEPLLRCSRDTVTRFFGNLPSFLERLCRVIEQPEVLRAASGYDDFLRLLSDVDDDLLPALREESALTGRFRQALLTLCVDETAYSQLRGASAGLLGRLCVSGAERTALQRLLLAQLEADPPWAVQQELAQLKGAG
ncbi:zinc ribbon domain-containing protein [Deinococcus sp. Arct2-2]|uniref:zinc ribbon domain-containing protein n=1 Tax=Deinococcus sp. Arct2-2 TaxID=2568653 RepID=UPI0010A4D3DC|nr:zinc ribbon domain-containing protein [Deinococcus sp. Arct2-2]THF67615.1 zinc ribbon domain-containing protein [Deinococcus sp. Arct2-2]